MKKTFTILGLLIGLMNLFGDPIDENTAKNVGLAFLTGNTNSTKLKSAGNLEVIYKAETKQCNPSGSAHTTTLFYVFNASSSGFVIVAGDDNVTPILGYSDEGKFAPDHIPNNVAKWLEGYKSEIRHIIGNSSQKTREIYDKWQALKNGNSINSLKSLSNVNPLLQTKWNQSPYYNAQCPGGSVTGCVATATAQVMKFWNYPATGSGFHSYNHNSYGTLSANFGGTTYQWSSMPNTVSSSNNAVATLMYQIGVSVDMNYSPESSGAYVISSASPKTNCAEYALKTYFGYKSTLQGVQRKNYTDVQWLNLLKTDFNAGRPIIYAGFGSGGGHCFVADGYDSNDYIHFNWGWGGSYDGYFQINALNPSGTGTGGGSGGFNSNHQAVIGIEPPSGTQTYNMALYNYVTPSATSIYYGQAFTITTNLINNGSTTFTGDYTAAIFDNAYNFVDYVQTLSNYSLQSGYVYKNNLVFSTTGLFGMLPGTYYVGIFYRPTGGNWYQAGNNGSYTNLIQMTVYNSNPFELNSAMSVTPGTTITEGQPLSVNLNIVNNRTDTFVGQYDVGLYKLDGSLAQTIGIIDENKGVPPGYTYLSPYLTFSTSSVDVSPGTYLLAMLHNPRNTGWQLTGSTHYQNPIKVKVVAPSLTPDNYEKNELVTAAYTLPVSFGGNSATINTNGSNMDNGSDNDYYKIVLPAGYNYTISARLHDSYNSGNGNTYTVDALFSYSTNGTTWSDTYDDVMSGNIVVNGSGTVYFHVAPYFAGETGTYLLDLSLSRTVNSGITNTKIDNSILVYPNPAKDFITIDLKDYNGEIAQITVISGKGELISMTDLPNLEKTVNLPVSNLPDGVYFLKIQTNKGIFTKKIVIEK